MKAAPVTDSNHKQLSFSAGIASVVVALCLVGLKLWALGETGSLSVAASLADSALDLIMSLGGLAAILYAARPPDEDHAFGHTSAEDLAALGQSVFILVSATVIAFAAVQRLISDTPHELAAEGRGLVAMGISILLTLGLVAWQRYVIRRTGNRVVAADSLHYLSDLLPNIGAIVALIASARYGLNQVDNIVALSAAAMLTISALHIGKGAWDALMDRTADPKLVADIEKIARGWPGVLGYHDLKTRTAGSRVFVHLHIEVDGAQSLFDAHEIAASLKGEICRTYPQIDLIIHKDPAR